MSTCPHGHTRPLNSCTPCRDSYSAALGGAPTPPEVRVESVDPALHPSRDLWGRTILTVGVLRALLADVEDDRHVVIATDDWYANVEAVAAPDDNSWQCLTLFPGDDFDTRQF